MRDPLFPPDVPGSEIDGHEVIVLIPGDITYSPFGRDEKAVRMLAAGEPITRDGGSFARIDPDQFVVRLDRYKNVAAGRIIPDVSNFPSGVDPSQNLVSHGVDHRKG